MKATDVNPTTHRRDGEAADGHASDAHAIDRHAIDAQARQAHVAALDALSPRVRAQLQQRRRAALKGTGANSGLRWAPALAMAATLALAVGLGVHLLWPQTPEASPDSALIAAGNGEPSHTNASVDTSTDSLQSATRTGSEPTGDTGEVDAMKTRVAEAAPDTAPLASPTADALDADLNAIAALLAMPSVDPRSAETASTTSNDIAQDDALLAALEDSPDFYLWLAADDGADVEAL